MVFTTSTLAEKKNNVLFILGATGTRKLNFPSTWVLITRWIH